MSPLCTHAALPFSVLHFLWQEVRSAWFLHPRGTFRLWKRAVPRVGVASLCMGHLLHPAGASGLGSWRSLSRCVGPGPLTPAAAGTLEPHLHSTGHRFQLPDRTAGWARGPCSPPKASIGKPRASEGSDPPTSSPLGARSIREPMPWGFILLRMAAIWNRIMLRKHISWEFLQVPLKQIEYKRIQSVLLPPLFLLLMGRKGSPGTLYVLLPSCVHAVSSPAGFAVRM